MPFTFMRSKMAVKGILLVGILEPEKYLLAAFIAPLAPAAQNFVG